MPESSKYENIKAKPVNPGDQFAISESQKMETQKRLTRVEKAGKANLFNNLSQQRWELLANFQKEVLAIFTSSNYDIDQTVKQVEEMPVPKEWKVKALEFLDDIILNYIKYSKTYF